MMTVAAARRSGARYHMKPKAIGMTITTENCAAVANPNANPSSRMRFQFHSTTSRGAYNVCASPMAVKIAPKAPQSAMTLGCTVDARTIAMGEKAYRTSAMYPATFPYSRRATYQSDAPKRRAIAMNGSLASHFQDGGMMSGAACDALF